MTGLTIDADISLSTDLLGKSASDLQTDVEVGEDGITGTLKYVSGFTGFSGNAELQEGNYIALHAECEGANRITAELIGGISGPVALDEDGIVIFRVTSTEQQVKFTASKAGYSDNVIKLSLEDIVLTESEE